MPVITRLEPYIRKDGEDGIKVFVDGRYGMSARARLVPALGISVGDEVDLPDLITREKFFFKGHHSGSWKAEKYRIGRVCDFLKWVEPGIQADVCGFGADSLDMILEHPKVPGSPDLKLSDAAGTFLMNMEVTGTARRRGEGFWVRPDKIDWAQAHPNEEFWVALHYGDPASSAAKEELFFFKPELDQKYEFTTHDIRGAKERYVVLQRKDVVHFRDFKPVLADLVERLRTSSDFGLH